MTSVHGESQQGGRLPADIWHAYMAPVTEGQPCVPFAEPKETLTTQPFFGKYASTGEAAEEAKKEHKGKKNPHRGGNSEKGGTGGNRAAPPTEGPSPPPQGKTPTGPASPGTGNTGGAAPR
jgi:membrane carboxypeptidase/penicillin-binding protein